MWRRKFSSFYNPILPRHTRRFLFSKIISDSLQKIWVKYEMIIDDNPINIDWKDVFIGEPHGDGSPHFNIILVDEVSPHKYKQENALSKRTCMRVLWARLKVNSGLRRCCFLSLPLLHDVFHEKGYNEAKSYVAQTFQKCQRCVLDFPKVVYFWKIQHQYGI